MAFISSIHEICRVMHVQKFGFKLIFRIIACTELVSLLQSGCDSNETFLVAIGRLATQISNLASLIETVNNHQTAHIQEKDDLMTKLQNYHSLVSQSSTKLKSIFQNRASITPDQKGQMLKEILRQLGTSIKELIGSADHLAETENRMGLTTRSRGITRKFSTATKSKIEKMQVLETIDASLAALSASSEAAVVQDAEQFKIQVKKLVMLVTHLASLRPEIDIEAKPHLVGLIASAKLFFEASQDEELRIKFMVFNIRVRDILLKYKDSDQGPKQPPIPPPKIHLQAKPQEPPRSQEPPLKPQPHDSPRPQEPIKLHEPLKPHDSPKPQEPPKPPEPIKLTELPKLEFKLQQEIAKPVSPSPEIKPNLRSDPPSTPRDTDEELFISSALQIIQEVCPNNWAALTPRQREAFITQIRQNLKTYQCDIIANQILKASAEPSSKLPFQSKPTQSNLLALFQFSTEPGFPPSPAIRLSKDISEAAFALTNEIFSLVRYFNDDGIAYLENRKKLVFTKDEIEKTQSRPKIAAHLEKLLGLLKQSLPRQPSKCEPIEIIYSRVKAEMAEKQEVAEVLPFDQSIFSQGQMVRLVKQSLLTTLFHRALSIRSCTTHYLTSIRAYDGGEASFIYLISFLSLFLKTLKETNDDLETYFTILYTDASGKPPLKDKATALSNSSPLWSEPEELKSLDLTDRYRPGSLNRLVLRLIQCPFDQDFTSAFMICCAGVNLTQELWARLEEGFHVPKNAGLPDDEANFVKLHVARVIHHWLKEDLPEMDPTIIASIDHFSSKALKKWNTELSLKIKKELLVPDRFAVRELRTFGQPAPIPIYGLSAQLHQIIASSDPSEVALQLTIIELEIYHRIDLRQLIDARWSKPKYQILARDAVALITRCERVSFFVVNSILLQKRLRDRIKILGKFIQVARICFHIKNYNTLIAIMVGLGHGAISRLAHTWKGLGQPDRVYKDLLPLANPSSNFKSIREVMQQEQNIMVPYVGVSLADITFTYEGNPDYVKVEDQELVNFPKFHMINRWIKQFQYHQNNKNDFKKSELLHTLLSNLHSVTDKEMYSMSLFREPRGSLLKDIDH